MEWKEIKNHENYMVSETGLIKSIDRTVTDKANRSRKYKGMILKPIIGYGGYKVIQIRVKMKKSCMYIHRVVAEHFCSGYSPELVVNHKDENKLNNNKDNLEFVTLSENFKHSRKSNAFMKRKFNNSEIFDIRKAYSQGESIYSISKRLNENSGTISNIINKKTYKNV